jgi:hypothetical protein
MNKLAMLNIFLSNKYCFLYIFFGNIQRLLQERFYSIFVKMESGNTTEDNYNLCIHVPGLHVSRVGNYVVNKVNLYLKTRIDVLTILYN